MITRSYDVIVAGFRPGGLLTAALLAKKGFRVLVLNQDNEEPVSHGEYIYPSHRYCLLGFEDKEFLGSAIDELTIHPTERKSIQASLPSFQFVSPNYRVDVYPDDRFKRELQREFKKDDVQIEAFYARARDEAGVFLDLWHKKLSNLPLPTILQKLGLGKWRRKEKNLFHGQKVDLLIDVYEQMGLANSVRCFFNSQLTMLSYVANPEYLPMPIASHLIISARGGFYRSQTSPEPLIQLLLERLSSLHSDVFPTEHITSLSFKWGKLKEVFFEGYDNPISCQYLVWNSSYKSLLDVIPDNAQKKGYKNQITESEFEQFSIYVTLDEFVIPVGMYENVFIISDENKPHLDGNILWITISPENSETFAEEGKRTMTITTILNNKEGNNSKNTKRELAQIMLKNLSQTIPYLEKHIKNIHIPKEDNLVLRPVFDSEKILSNYNSDIGRGLRLPHWNIFHIGRESYPSVGFDGEIGAGIMAARAILALQK